MDRLVYDQSLPSVYPYVAGVTFRKFCDHQVCCTVESIDPDTVMLGDTVYVADWYIEWFMKNVHPHIQRQYILVSGDSDELHPSFWYKEAKILYDKKVGAWFCKDMVLSRHPKLFTIPVGQTAMNWSFPLDTFSEIAGNGNKLDFPLLYSSYTTLANDNSRRYVRDLFLDQPFCYTENNPLDKAAYWRALAQYKFVLAPCGTVLDSPRVWEALSLHTIPLCRHSPLDALYEGTAAVLVYSWEEITEEFLNKKFLEVQEKLLTGEITHEKAHFDYWARQILQVKNAIKEGSWQGAELEAAHLFDQEELDGIKEVLYHKHEEPSDLPSRCLFVAYGKCLGLRAFQLSHAMSGFMKILVLDDYALGTDEHHRLMSSFAKEESQYLFPNNAAQFARTDLDLSGHIRWLKNCRVKMFIDLTHYRHQFIDRLWAFCQTVPFGSVICGNMADDPDVKEQLHEFSARYSVPVDIKSGLWSYRKAHYNKLAF